MLACFCRRELKDLKDAAYRQLLVGHGQEKERTLLGLRRSLNRGLWHSVGGLGDELSEKAREKRQRCTSTVIIVTVPRRILVCRTIDC